MTENENLTLEYSCMDFTHFLKRPAIKYITNFFLSFFLSTSAVQYMEGLLHIILHSVLDSYKAVLIHIFQSKR